MNKKFLFFTSCVCIAILLTGCHRKYPGYKKTADGVYYRFLEENTKSNRPQLTDYLKMKMSYFMNDSVLYSWTEHADYVRTQLKAPGYYGDLQSGLALMHEGDSASFILPADSTFVHVFGVDLKDFHVKPEDIVRYEVRLVAIQSEDEFKAEVEQIQTNMREQSLNLFDAYVKKNTGSVSPLESGVYIIPLSKGKGRCPVVGEEVELDYSVSLIVNDSLPYQIGKDDHFAFVLGEGYAIPAWEEVVPMMRLGASARVIVPSKMAYGEHAFDGLPPYSNLIYDMKLVKITPAKEVAKRRAEEMKALQEKSEQHLSDYLKENNITVAPQASGLYHIIRQEGNGVDIDSGMVVQIRYSARMLDGTLIASSDELGQPYSEILVGGGRAMKGLDEGLELMREGEKATLIVPYYLAYGNKGFQGIPPYANLVFEVELLHVLSKEEQQTAVEKVARDNFDRYLKIKGINESEKRPSGLVYVKTKEGSGERPQSGSKVTVHFTGKLLDGTVFDSSMEHGEPISFVLGKENVIKGLEEGLLLMQKGEKATLILPFDLAYGDQKRGAIPPYSSLVFDVELIDIENTNN